MRCPGGTRRAVVALLSLVAVTLPPIGAGAQHAPSPVVERSLEVTGRTVRVSLFDNCVVVVSVRRGSERVLLRRQTLDSDECAGYLAALQHDADELAEARRHHGYQEAEGNGLITIYLGADAPARIRYSSLAVLDVTTARLVATLDDLEARVLWGPVHSPELAAWEPRRGDRVELRSGVTATVREVREDGTVVLEHDGTGIHEMVPADARSQVILRILKRRQ